MLNIGDLKQYILLNIKLNLSVSDIAVFFGVSRQYLHRYFKDNSGETIMSYINNKKLEMAAIDLLMYPCDLAYVSQRYNFKTTSYFRSKFEDRFNMAPEEFMNKYMDMKC